MRTPQHDIDAVPTLVLPGDPAWDDERIEAETKDLEPEERAAHPYIAYMAGDTRYDLHAESRWSGGVGSAADYLNGDYLRIELRRLSLREQCQVADEQRREQRKHGRASSFITAYLSAALSGVAAIHGDDDLAFKPGTNMPEATLDALCQRFGGIGVVAQIGAAAYVLTLPLSDSEKKR